MLLPGTEPTFWTNFDGSCGRSTPISTQEPVAGEGKSMNLSDTADVFFWKRKNLPEFVRLKLYTEHPHRYIWTGQGIERRFYLWTGTKRGGILQTGFSTICTRICRKGRVVHLYADYPLEHVYRGHLLFLPKARQLIHSSQEIYLKTRHTLWMGHDEIETLYETLTSLLPAQGHLTRRRMAPSVR